MPVPIRIAVLQICRRAYPALLFLAFLVAGFGFQRLQAWAGGLLSPRQAVQKHAKEIATAFQPFAPKVKTRSDEKYFYVESNGMPDQTIMVGITNWQQQVPLPQTYVGQNAWQFPLTPVPAANPLSGKNHFFRGAMAIAVDGVPIFNALNNRGDDSFAIGELDTFGGHCGRADDYHYHIAPLHLTKTVGKDKPVGYALDGYALYGLTEPDGSPPGKLDEFNGHTTPQLGYHYHGTKTYPYLNGGFHGEVVERGGQVDPQPRANPVRPDTRPLRGAKITGFEQPKAGNYSLTYTVNGETYKINYALQTNGAYKFDYVDAQGRVTSQTYSGRGLGGGGRGDGNGPPPRHDDGNGPPPPRPDGEPGGQGGGPSQQGEQGGGQGRGGQGRGGQGRGGQGRGEQRGGPGGGQGRGATLSAAAQEPSNTHPLKGFVLSSPSIGADGVLPKEFTGDGDASTLPLEWKGGPAETKSYAVIMHHIDPQGMVKRY